MPRRSQPVTRVLLGLALVLGATVARSWARAGILIRPDEFLRLKLNYTLQNLVEDPPDRCRPETRAVSAARSNSAPCNLLFGSVSYGGECHQLMKRGPCPSNHWLVIDKNTERATCRFQVCSNHHVLVAGGCTRLGRAASARHCRRTLQLIINEYGEAECECPMRRVYHAPSRKCYSLYEQGPCGRGNVLQVVERDGRSLVDCVPSLCPTAGQVPMTAQCELVNSTSRGGSNYRCYKLSSSGPCTTGFLALDVLMLNVVCITNHPYGIFSSLTGGTPCTPGSVRDTMRDCRSRTRTRTVQNGVTRTIPTVKPGYYGQGNVCPKNYVFLAGTCLHIQSGH